MKTKHLGKNNTKTQVGYKILDPIIRDRLSESYGIDIWNAYEFSYLDANNLPVLKVLEISIPSCSKYIVESKSLKLYLNSFYNKKFIYEKDVLKKIQKDLNKITKSETNLRFIKKFSIEPHSLNINTSSRKLSKPNGVLCFDGFRSICPVTSQPDFAKIYIYTNAKVDINYIKRFLVSFKEKGEFHEQCIEYIFADLQNKYPCNDFEICGRFLRRGGIDINPIRSSKKKLFFKNFRAFNQ
ncbi:MAG: 7-cyano-7-deazaguanine reductase [Proteobacteria bacterium]|jgi:7-cyano-7-deazaguanine reductase|nr:7-cyano-7-deazaguanine reductase [Pseudomonadota bacterium]MDA1037753.1 7-cyano-7-deazaguanine reductase [Pseudomonadota bacterium]